MGAKGAVFRPEVGEEPLFGEPVLADLQRAAVGIEGRRLRQDIERVGGDVLELEGDDVAGPGEGP
jgi:hypothetical protein